MTITEQHLSVRVPPVRVFTTQQKIIIAMIANGMSYREIGKRLHIDWATVRNHAERAAAKIPGGLPIQTKIHFWVRGATIDQLTGEGWIPELKV